MLNRDVFEPAVRRVIVDRSRLAPPTRPPTLYSLAERMSAWLAAGVYLSALIAGGWVILRALAV